MKANAIFPAACIILAFVLLGWLAAIATGGGPATQSTYSGYGLGVGAVVALAWFFAVRRK